MAFGDSVAGLDPFDQPTTSFLLPTQLRHGGRRAARPIARLTPREVQVAHLLCLGRNNAEIATTISISLSTTRRHVEHIFAKLGVHRRAEVLARLIGMSGLILRICDSISDKYLIDFMADLASIDFFPVAMANVIRVVAAA